jgi:choline kinase
LLQNNNDVKDLKIKELEANLIDLDKIYCQTRMDKERKVMDLNNEILGIEKELDSTLTQIKIQSHGMAELNDKNNKLTSELIMTEDSYNRDKKYYSIEFINQNKDIHNLNSTLCDVNHEMQKLTMERDDILT